MAGRETTLTVKILADAAQATRELNQTVSGLAGFAKNVTTALVGAFAVDKVIDGVRGMVNAASQLEQSMGGVDSVFKQNAQQIHSWASDTSDSIRLPAAEFEQLATVIGSQLKNAGVSMDQLGGKTKDIMQLGADLAANFGTSVPQAIEAISSALKRETDPIERYGVTITDASLQAEKAALGLDGLTGAADQNATAMATLSIITKQTADSQGAAARESDSFQARLDSLKEKMTNAAAQAGKPLLESLGNLVDRISDLTPAVEGGASVLAGFVNGIAQLPTPVLAAGAALTALVVIGPTLMGFFRGFGAVLTAFTTQMAVVRAEAAVTGAAMTRMGVAASAAGTIVSKAFGGLPGLILAVGSVIAGLVLGDKMLEWADDANKAADATARFKNNVADYGATIHSAIVGEMGGAESGLKLREQAYSHIDDAWKGLIGTGETVSSTFKSVDTDTGTALDGLMGNATQAQKVIDGFNTKIAGLEAQRDSLGERPWGDIWKFWDSGPKTKGELDPSIQENIDKQTELRDKYEALIPEITQARLEEDARNGVLGTGVQAMQLQIDAEKEYETALKDTNQYLKDQQQHFKILASQTGVAQMLDEVARSQERVARGSQALNTMFEQADQRSSSYEQTTLNTHNAVFGLGDAFKKAVEEGKPVAQLISDWDWGGIMRELPGVSTGILDMRKSFGDSTIAAFEAAGGFKNFEGGLAAASVQMKQNETDFRDMLAAAGLTDDEINTIVGSMDEFNQTDLEDKLMKIKAEDFEARQTALYWESITFDPVTKQFVTSIDIPETQTIVQQLNANLPKDTKVPVTPSIQPPTNVPPGVVGGALTGQGPQTAPTITVPMQIQNPTATQAPGLFGKLFINNTPVTAPAVNIPSNVQTPTGATSGPAGQAVTTGGTVTGGTVQIQVQAGTTAAQGAITALTTQSRTLTIQVAANAAQAQGTIQSVVGGRYQTTLFVLGDNNAAISSIRNVTTGRYETTVFVKGDNNDAIRQIRNVTTGYYDATVHILGDNSGAISALRAITTGYYSTTVHINADASAFYSVYNSLPTSRTVTVVTQAAPAAVPQAQMAVRGMQSQSAGLARASAALSAAAPMMSRGSSGGGTVINVNGALDPDAVARQISRLLLARDRRSGGVKVGLMRTRVGQTTP